jgi:hypothetical protein
VSPAKPKTPSPIAVYLEIGSKRVFAGAVEWPGWCRSGRDEESALEALAVYRSRYAAAIGRAHQRFDARRSSYREVERVKGNATTDFGAPSVAPKADERRLGNSELRRQRRLLEACWRALDEAVEAHASAVLRKGPRGGGRELDAIVSHVLESDGAYLTRLGAPYRKTGGDIGDETSELRAWILDAVTERAHGEPPPKPPRSGVVWSPRQFVRRSAWHALDHAWEIEDRAFGSPS